MENNLKEESYYSDSYDVFTITECLRLIEFWRSNKEIEKPIDGEVPSKEQVLQAMNFDLYTTKGERFRSKSSFVQKCMSRDRERDEFLRDAAEPVGVRCPNCFESMKVMLKNLNEDIDGALRVLFAFECSACKKRKCIFDNGEAYKSKPELCPKCSRPIKTSCSEKGENLVWTRTCSACGFRETEIDDFEKMRKEREKREREEVELLRKHRAEFCLSPEKGEEYLQARRNMEELKNLLEKHEQRQADPDYKKAKDIKKLTVFELEKTLAGAIEKERYLKLSLEKPETGRYIIIPFSVLDTDSSRKDWDSIRKLQKAIKKALAETNWRLMSEGVSYKLGYLSGRLKGYDSEEDFVQLIKQEKSKLKSV